jgi:indolepyruvate decarboxylase
VPGDYVLALCKLIEESPIRFVGTTGELPAGYAADAYARLNGLGLCVVTYGVGAFSAMNGVACAYAEKSPVVFISGAAGLKERKRGQLLHHTVGAYNSQLQAFEPITCAQAVLDDPLTALREIDRVLEACRRFQRPVYIEIPRDRVLAVPPYPASPISEPPVSDPDELRDAVAETCAMIAAAKQPLILAGIEVQRFGLQQALIQLAEKHGLPIAATLLSKSIIPERHPLYAGVYQAGMGRPEVSRFVEESDCLLSFGTLLTDIDTGMFTHVFDAEHAIHATSEELRIRRHTYPDVRLVDFVAALAAAELPKFQRVTPPAYAEFGPWQAEPGRPLSVIRLFQKINSVLRDETIVLADPGDALFAAADLVGPAYAAFLAPAFYATLGWAVPAAVGAQLAQPDRRPLVLVGDGSFQFTGQEFSTAIRLGLDPIVVVLNNRGYLTEKLLLDGAFNEVANWHFHKLPDVYGGGRGYECRTEDELDAALDDALATRGMAAILNVHLPPDDTSPALKRLGERLAPRV